MAQGKEPCVWCGKFHWDPIYLQIYHLDVSVQNRSKERVRRKGRLSTHDWFAPKSCEPCACRSTPWLLPHGKGPGCGCGSGRQGPWYHQRISIGNCQPHVKPGLACRDHLEQRNDNLPGRPKALLESKSQMHLEFQQPCTEAPVDWQPLVEASKSPRARPLPCLLEPGSSLCPHHLPEGWPPDVLGDLPA